MGFCLGHLEGLLSPEARLPPQPSLKVRLGLQRKGTAMTTFPTLTHTQTSMLEALCVLMLVVPCMDGCVPAGTVLSQAG